MTNSFIENIQSKKKDFTDAELKIANLLEQEPFVFSSSTATEIANKFNVSQSSISRFCQKLGYHGFSDFRMSLILSLSTSVPSNNTTNEWCATLCSQINQLSQSINDEHQNKIANMIINARVTYTSGYGASEIAANLLAFRSMLLSLNVFEIPTSREVETLHLINNQDLIILFSASNPSHRDLISMLDDMPKEKRPKLILVTESLRHPFIKKVDEVVMLPKINNDNPYLSHQSVQLLYVLLLLPKIAYLFAQKNKD